MVDKFIPANENLRVAELQKFRISVPFNSSHLNTIDIVFKEKVQRIDKHSVSHKFEFW
jgi:hypothetical protein